MEFGEARVVVWCILESSHAGLQQGSHRDHEDKEDAKVHHSACCVSDIQDYRACMQWTMGCMYYTVIHVHVFALVPSKARGGLWGLGFGEGDGSSLVPIHALPASNRNC